MNWYKKANLQETLPYFQEFEEMGEYVPNEESLNAVLENQFGATIVSDIGQGDSGVAYLLSNGDVLKITTNNQEGQVAKYFQDNPNPSVVEYKLVWKEGDLYYIVMEKIDQMAVDDPMFYDIFEHINDLKNSNQCYNPVCMYELIKNDKEIQPELKQVLLPYISSLQKIPVKLFDFLNINNIGIKDGQLIFFDIT